MTDSNDILDDQLDQILLGLRRAKYLNADILKARNAIKALLTNEANRGGSFYKDELELSPLSEDDGQGASEKPKPQEEVSGKQVDKLSELYGRLHELIEWFQNGNITAEAYSIRHEELTDQISELQSHVQGNDLAASDRTSDTTSANPHEYKPNGFGYDCCLKCGKKVSEHPTLPKSEGNSI